jgi:N-acetylmuramoyl-L-alanine amidase
MAVCDQAWFKPITRNFNHGRMSTVYGLVVHITSGHGNIATVWGDFDRVQNRVYKGKPEPKKSAQFCVSKSGELWQFIDTSNRAWALDGGSHDSHWISVENIATYGERLTDQQVTGCAVLLNWLHKTYGTPFRRSRHKSDPGLNYHEMFSGPGHPCPGFPVRMQLERIVREAWYWYWRETGDDSTPAYIRTLI